MQKMLLDVPLQVSSLGRIVLCDLNGRPMQDPYPLLSPLSIKIAHVPANMQLRLQLSIEPKPVYPDD